MAKLDFTFSIEEADNAAANTDDIATHFATQTVLAKNWLTPEEDEAWQDL